MMVEYVDVYSCVFMFWVYSWIIVYGFFVYVWVLINGLDGFCFFFLRYGKFGGYV